MVQHIDAYARTRGMIKETDGLSYSQMINWLTIRENAVRPAVLEHERRVAVSVMMLCSRIRMSPERTALLVEGARLHDVGKLAVADAVLFKPGILDKDETVEMRKHAECSFLLLDREVAPAEVLNIARYHHERFDGHGYHGLRGAEIPLEARIVSVADVYDALVARREYKNGMNPAEALALMTADVPSPGFGRHAFDPAVLGAFVSMTLSLPNFEATDKERSALEAFASEYPMVVAAESAEEMPEILRVLSLK